MLPSTAILAVVRVRRHFGLLLEGFDVDDTAERLLEVSEHARHPSNGPGGGMAEDGGKPDHAEAQRMLDICASVGAKAVDLTLTSSGGEKEQFRRNLALAELGRMLPAMLDDATRRKRRR
jgi:hypothetical protein